MIDDVSESTSRRLLGSLLAVTVTAAVFGLLLSHFAPTWRWEHLPYHSFVEALGSTIALIVAFILLRLRSSERNRAVLIRVSAALASMGVLDGLHAVVYPGLTFIWLHSLSNMVGGLLLASVWLPGRFFARQGARLLPVTVAIGWMLVGLLSLLSPEWIPQMRQGGEFTLAASLMNLAGGLGFIAAAIFFIRQARKGSLAFSPVLANHCLLFGLAGLLFQYSTLWDGIWWEWHGLRLAAYGFILYFSLLSYRNERVLEARRLRTSEQRFSLAMRGANEGLWDWELLTDALYLAPRWKSMLGYGEHELLDAPATLLEMVHAEEREAVRRKLEDCRSGSSEIFEAQFRMRHKHGYWVHILSKAHLVRDEQGRPARLVGTHQDISLRVEAEMELMKLSKAIAFSSESILITDAEGSIEYVNPAFTRITGYTEEEVIGQNPRILKSDVQEPAFYEDMWGTITRGKPWSGTLIDRKKDGTYFPAMLSIAPIMAADGMITHYIAIQNDMTEHQRLEEQFRQAQKMESIGTLVGGIAHDFNNMLAAIEGNLYLAKKHMNEPEVLEQKLDRMIGLSQRAAEIVRQLLTYARKDIVHMQPLSLNEFMKDGLLLAETTIPDNVEHRLELCEEELSILGDATQLQQVVMNLLNNACHAVSGVDRPAVRCRLSAYEADDDFMGSHPHLETRELACITVSDNGCGISQKNRERIIEPFFTTKGVGEGTGLGLSMVFGAVQRHGGVLEVDSELGKGSSFHIYIPRLAGQIGSHDSQEYDTECELDGKGETILVVDDQEDVLQTTLSVVEDHAYRTVSAVNGEEALALFAASPDDIALIVTDVVMPKVGGVEMMDQVWRIRPEMPVVFLTGYDHGLVDLPADKSDRSRLMAKPYFIVDLCRAIRELLDARED